MHELAARDGDRVVDWGKTSKDYAVYRTCFPDSFFARLEALGVGLAGQRVLDLGTGTGVLARALARRGCQVVGIDISRPQIEMARELAASEGLGDRVDFRVGPAEEPGLLDGSVDVVAAAQSWLYFDRERMIPEVLRVLAPGGVLLTCHLCWLPRLDRLARATEELVLRHNPDWSCADFSGRIPALPAWAEGCFEVKAMFWYDQGVPFTREGWRGRIRACRGVGASLNPGEVERFDRELADLLEAATPTDGPFEVLHRVDAHVLVPADS